MFARENLVGSYGGAESGWSTGGVRAADTPESNGLLTIASRPVTEMFSADVPSS
jgi:hypothetical protein